MKADCFFYYNWPDDGMPHWCTTMWKVCDATGDDCQAFTPKITPEAVRKEKS